MLTRKPASRISTAMELRRMKSRMPSKTLARTVLVGKVLELPLDRPEVAAICELSMFLNLVVHL